jgi:tRNA pseudouridine55 synthase
MNGVLVIDKPAGWTSHDVVAKIRNLTGIKKVGHTGILDPFATGVLPLTMGRATRLTNYFLSSDKLYQGVIKFGYATTTFDVDGEALGEDSKPNLDPDRLSSIFSDYVGTIEQTIPPYSAKKVRGKPMYSYARKGVALEKSTKRVTIKTLRLISIEGCEVEFELECVAGTYVRSLAHDVGQDYGCGAHLVRLRRTKSGEFPIEDATVLGDGSRFFERDYFTGRIIPMGELLLDIPAIVLSPGDRKKIIHGMDMNLLTSQWEADEYRLLDESGDLVAIGQRLQTFASPVAQPACWIRIHPKTIFVQA